MSSIISASQHQMNHLRSIILSLGSDPIKVFQNTLLPSVKRSKFKYLGAAIALYVVNRLYRVFAYPKKLGHLERVPVLSTLKSLIASENDLDRARKFLLPRWKETDGIMAAWGQFGWEVVVSNPEAARAVLYKTEIFPKSSVFENPKHKTLIVKFFGNTNMSLANAHEWRKRRKIANPAFKRSMPAKTFALLTSRMFEQIEKIDGPVHVQKVLQRFTLDAIGLIGFGFEFNATNTPEGEWVRTYNDVADNIADFRYLFLPALDTTYIGLFPERQKKHESLNRLNKLFDQIIKNKKLELAKGASNNVEDNEKDLLTLMIEAGNGDDQHEPLTSEELRDELVLFFIAGHDTTSNTMTAALYFLAANPDIQTKARREVLDVLGDDPLDVWPTVDQLKEFPYLTKVMKESVRLAPSAPALLVRDATVGTELNGVIIPKGTLVKVDVISLHYNPNLWKNPTKFDPERFAEGGELESMPSTYAYLPFGGGSRQCIGMNFSLAEQRVALSSILRKYELSLPEGSIHKDGIVFGSQMLNFGAKEMNINFTPRY
ncbi:cytochrome P450 [Umbelopsis sp. AD052]|nr:cytochrome P450 [Umbelopsis sp. AD052]